MKKLIEIKKVMSVQRGFTLIEVLIAMVIATVGLLGLTLMQGSAIEGNGTSSKFSQATFLAQDMLESIKDGNVVAEGTFGFVDMDTYGGPNIMDSGTSNGIDENGDPGGPFNLQWTVFANTDWSRRVTVNVTWNTTLGITRGVNLESISRGDGN